MELYKQMWRQPAKCSQYLTRLMGSLHAVKLHKYGTDTNDDSGNIECQRSMNQKLLPKDPDGKKHTINSLNLHRTSELIKLFKYNGSIEHYSSLKCKNE